MWISPPKLKRIRRKILSRWPNIIHVGNRAFCTTATRDSRPFVKKTFDPLPQAKRAYRMEVTASERFAAAKWMPATLMEGRQSVLRRQFPQDTRLDLVSRGLNRSEKLSIADQAMEIIFEIFLAGYAHRDFHAGNLYWVDNQLYLIDFETLAPYPESNRPPFPASYDVVGTGLPSPFQTQNMGYGVDHPKSIQSVLGVTTEEALERLETRLRDSLYSASGTFRRPGSRHICKEHKIYTSFDLPYLGVSPVDAQRNSARRLERFGITKQSLAGKRVLDIGCNTGGMLFQSQQFEPADCFGLEYDEDKVDAALQIAAYNGLNNFHIIQRDIDDISPNELGTFDVTYCFAVEAHVKNASNLFSLLGAVTKECLYFEGNGKTDVSSLKSSLLKGGFSSVEFLGVSDDDCVPTNNRRPLLVARKAN